MTHDEMIAVITAHKEGKQIQFMSQYGGEWTDCSKNKPTWDFSAINYRVKPGQKCRPYESAEEFINGMKEHGHLMYIRGCKCYKNVNSIGNHSISIIWDSLKIEDIDYNDVLQRMTHQDGTPCGVQLNE